MTIPKMAIRNVVQVLAGTRTANSALKAQQFTGYDQMILTSGIGHRVGNPTSAGKCLRGDVAHGMDGAAVRVGEGCGVVCGVGRR